MILLSTMKVKLVIQVNEVRIGKIQMRQNTKNQAKSMVMPINNQHPMNAKPNSQKEIVKFMIKTLKVNLVIHMIIL